MRLDRIRLSGFKSFVDATPVVLGSGITAIVGPNGCGKSNIIDAVRWVMGERSARHLRGGSMADVIFSGSGSRRPVGQASIELVFDNADGSLGGQYAGFAEISIRRQVNRDGQSAYFLNGSRCRRRDITEVFLGTGLGSRSYSIIEQGTISRLIEARPETLRAYLEEAAGISLYKERRQETERRMRDTRGNLDRLEDMRGEVARRLERLNDQARTAERYRALKAEERQRQVELTLLRIRRLEADSATLASELAAEETALEARLAGQRRSERDTESLRAEQTASSDHLNAVQARYYELGSALAALEQQLRHDRDTRARSERELEQIREAIRENDTALADDRREAQTLAQTIATETRGLAEADGVLSAADADVTAATRRLEAAREARDAVVGAQADAERQNELEQTRIEQIEARQREQNQRLERIDAERQALETTAMDTTDDDGERIDALESERTDRVECLAMIDQSLAKTRGERDPIQAELDAQRAALTRDQARLTSLQTLQDEALGSDQAIARWLSDRGIDARRRLVDQLDVTPGWERAVEWVLERALQALESTDAEVAGGRQALPTSGEVMLFAPPSAMSSRDSAPSPRSLAAQVAGPEAAIDLLRGVYGAADAEQAREWLADLPPGASVITPEGHWYGRGWLRLRATPDDPQAGVVARARAIEVVTDRIESTQAAIDDAATRLGVVDTRLDDLDARHQAMLDRRHALDRELAAAHARRESAQTRRAADRAQHERLSAERAELVEAMTAGASALDGARGRQRQARAEADTAAQRRRPVDDDCQSARTALDAAREAATTARERRQAVALRLERARTAHQSREQAIARLEQQDERLRVRVDELQTTIDALADPDQTREAERQSLLAQRAESETALANARRTLDDREEALRRLDRERLEAEQAVRERREACESLRHRRVEIEARLTTRREELESMPVTIDAVARDLSSDARESDHVAELERLSGAIEALGPINLAAIDEQAELAERKDYLDAQHTDLNAALETLENAIQRIDRETRERFQATFDEVSAGLQRLFPTLFGGGEAYLELTGADLLETGVTLMARPPGKRITNIHLLSGGEKALAAVALVFAIFELNPAPFCMLDEVDAPLDEANVGRFCDLLRTLSDRVQFIVITHNRITMEAASHLAGVTMAEPGVSRLVTVDVAAAVEMTNADT
ncbi:chromosome segregation protein SMC [Spiribacter vilamensis]|uniref:Chromosome partition protein Smc n=1 Tax=Spiribacter vilamensis TaxID=531306 RepID=A0A4Q8D0I0_9GAMM|nr:chromosome segregation protein SMC [Spiribacter vilamensis]RZU98841.1 condensin subunit Smc [Spiribacter vilamensis]TVO62141.1 chromosome segregation protein SMC [Spiribacter vilamensis]